METDFVDCAIEGWAKQWPELETEPLEVTGRLERIARHLDRRTGEAVSASGLSPRDLDVLGALIRADGVTGLPASECAKAAMVTSGGMTGQADRLAGAGLIVRKPDPGDRRAVLMSLTREGSDAVEQALKAYLQSSKEVLATLTEEEQAQLAELLKKLLVALEGTEQPGIEQASKPSRPSTSRRRGRFE
jgi:DNA-binding MarR family transcriptional regulator